MSIFFVIHWVKIILIVIAIVLFSKWILKIARRRGERRREALNSLQNILSGSGNDDETGE